MHIFRFTSRYTCAGAHRMDCYTSKYDNRASISMLNQDLQELVDAAVLRWSTDCMVFRLVYILAQILQAIQRS